MLWIRASLCYRAADSWILFFFIPFMVSPLYRGCKSWNGIPEAHAHDLGESCFVFQNAIRDSDASVSIIVVQENKSAQQLQECHLVLLLLKHSYLTQIRRTFLWL